MNPFETTILAGLKRCVTSAACQMAFGAVVVGAVTLYFSLPSLTTPATKSAAIIGFLGLIGVLARDIIAGFGAENVASIHANSFRENQYQPPKGN